QRLQVVAEAASAAGLTNQPDLVVDVDQLKLDGALKRLVYTAAMQPGALLEFRQRHGFGQAQPVEEVFKGQLGFGRRLELGKNADEVKDAQIGARGGLAAGAHNVTLGRQGELAVGAGDDADVVAKAPVVEVVNTFAARTGSGGNFVVMKAVGAHAP